jgi:hypothetical protein
MKAEKEAELAQSRAREEEQRVRAERVEQALVELQIKMFQDLERA